MSQGFAGASASGAPTGAKYITQQPDSGLSDEQALSLLATGLLKNTTSTGILSIAAEGTDYYAPGGTDVAVADGGTGASSFTDGGVLVGNGSGAIQVTSAGTAGQVLTSNGAGVDPTFQDSSGGAYDDSSDPVLLNTTTKDVIIAGASQINGSKVSIDGDTDQVQFSIQGHSTQTNDFMVIETSAGTERLRFTTDGTLMLGGDLSAKLNVVGAANEIQLAVRANATQSARIFVVENSAGTDLFAIHSDGQFIYSAPVQMDITNTNDSASNAIMILRGNDRATAVNGDDAYIDISLDDSGGTSSRMVRLLTRATDVTSGSEDSFFSIQITQANNLREAVNYQASSSGVLSTTFNSSSQDWDFTINDSGGAMFHIDAGAREVIFGNSGILSALVGINGQSDEIQLKIQGHSTQTNDILVIENSSGADKFTINSEGITNWAGTMGNGTDDPTTDAPVDWVEIKIAGTTRYIPVYN